MDAFYLCGDVLCENIFWKIVNDLKYCSPTWFSIDLNCSEEEQETGGPKECPPTGTTFTPSDGS
jgi:hypothetical protein